MPRHCLFIPSPSPPCMGIQDTSGLIFNLKKGLILDQPVLNPFNSMESVCVMS